MTLSERLQDVTEQLAATSSLEGVQEVILTVAREAVGAVAGAVLLVDEAGERLELAASWGLSLGEQAVWQSGPLDAPSPAPNSPAPTSPALDALRRREELFFEAAGALSASYPGLDADKVGWSVASAVLPMVTLEVPRGVIALDFREPHTFPPQERRFLRVLAVQCGHALSRLGGVRRLEALVQERTRELNTLARLGDALQQAATPEQISQLALEQLGPALGALCMLVVRLDGGQIRLPTIWGHPPAPILEYMTQPGLPLEALPLLNRVAGLGQGVYLDDYRQLEGGVSSFPSLAGAVEPIRTPDGQLEGFLVTWRALRSGWTPEHRLLMQRAAATLGLALERASATDRIQAQKEELGARTLVLEGFAELTRDLTLHGDPQELVRRAQQVVLSLLPGGYAAYYLPEGDFWRLTVQTGDRRDPGLQARVEAGLPLESTPSLLTPWRSREGYYLSEYDQRGDDFQEFAERRGAIAALPVLVSREPVGVFGVALFQRRAWTPGDKAMLETVVRSLGIALERADSLAQLAQRSRELEQRSRELERSNAELQQFAFVASHDLQEPLRSITSFSQLLVKRAAGSDDEKLQQYGRYISEGTDRMTQLLTDLLAFSRVASPGLTPKPVNTRLLLAQVQQDLGAQLRGSGARLLFGELPQTYGDPTQLRQLFQNLVGNAVKFAHPGRPPEVRVSAEPGEQAAHFEVADNGIGIEEAHFERIFLIFQRLHGRQQYPGSGIGLAIARKVVERHGGQLSLRSTPGEGTTFTFTLPTRPGSFRSV